MADNAFTWAAKHPGLIRVNEMHGEEEAKLVLSDSFEHVGREEECTTQRVEMEVEDTCWQ